MADPVALVVGAGDYIGSAIARRFARGGYTLCMGRRNGEKLAPLVAEIEASGASAHGFTLDAREEDQIQETFARIERDKLGRGSPTVFESFDTVDGKAVIARREEDLDGDGRIDDTLTYENGEPLRREISERVLAPL